MNAKPTYEELENRIRELERDLGKYKPTGRVPFDLKRAKDLLHPDWPDAKWNITGLFIHRRLLSDVLLLMQKLHVSRCLKSFHDAPDVIWNGGRMNMKVKFYEDSAEYFKALNDRGVGVYLTFSNLVLEQKHLDDPESNRLLECLDERGGMNGVIVANELLSEYLRKKKPGLRQTTSVVKSFIENPEGKVEWYLEMQKRYDRVVVHTDHMFNLDLLDQLDRSKTEILVNEECVFQCPNRQRHQLMTSEFNLDRSEEKRAEIQKLKKTSCIGSSNLLHYEKNPENRRPCYLNHREVKTIYDMGFREFKICGRRKPINNVAWNIIYYIVNPDLECLFADALYTKLDMDTKKAVQKALGINKQAKTA